MKLIPLTKGLFDYSFSLELEEVLYFFRLTYNSRTQTYSLSVRNADREPILMGIQLVEGATTSRFSIPELFPGYIVVVDMSLGGQNGTIETMGDTVKVFYVESDDTL